MSVQKAGVNMATIPLSGTNITLMSGIPFSNDYKNTRWFENKTQQNDYFYSRNQPYRMLQANFQRVEGYNYVSVSASIDELWNVNYMMFQNASYNNKWFYAFVTKLEYVQHKTTYVHFQIDVLQTWMFEMNFKPSFVIREHCPLWNDDGTPVINTVDEGLNYGLEYDITSVDLFMPNRGMKWLVIISKTAMHGTDKGKVVGTKVGVPQPLSYYVVPFMKNEPIIKWSTGSGEFEMAQPTKLMSELYKDKEAVNNIVSIYMTDFAGIGVNVTGDSQFATFSITNPNHRIIPADIGGKTTMYIDDMKTFDWQKEIVSDAYEGFEKPTESKLLMYPYSVLTVDDMRGNRADYKLEYITNKKIEMILKGSMGTSNKVSYGLHTYNKFWNEQFDEEISNEFALINNTPSDVPVLTDNLAAYLQGNKNSIENRKDSIMFNGAMNVLGSGMAGIGSAMQGNAGGVATAVTGVVQGAGNTVLQLQGIEAKQKDIANIPPQLSKMGSNIAYDYGNGYTGVFIIRKQIKAEYRRKLEDFFKMFGYKKNEVKMPNFHTRQNWNYVQTSSCNITGDFNNDDLNKLKAVFDNGITLWHTDDVGNYGLENGVI